MASSALTPPVDTAVLPVVVEDGVEGMITVPLDGFLGDADGAGTTDDLGLGEPDEAGTTEDLTLGDEDGLLEPAGSVGETGLVETWIVCVFGT